MNASYKKNEDLQTNGAINSSETSNNGSNNNVLDILKSRKQINAYTPIPLSESIPSQQGDTTAPSFLNPGDSMMTELIKQDSGSATAQTNT